LTSEAVRQPASTIYDVAIVGAGAAGMIAARDLARAGRSVALLEARDRVGGRLFAVNDPRALAPIELGGEFVHGRPHVTYDLLHEFGATVVDDAEMSFTVRDGRLEASADDPFESTATLLATALESETDCTVDDLIAREVARDRALHEAGRWAQRLVSGFDAADTARASARAIALEWAGDASADGAQSRPLGGYGALVAHLARSVDGSRVDLRLRTTVARIERDARGIRIETRSGTRADSIEARAAIVTVPVGVLAAEADSRGAIAFDPALPNATRAAIERIAMGPVTKIVLRFKDAFWERVDGGRFRDGAFFNGDGDFPTLWTQVPVRANTLVAWAGGPAAERMRGAGDDERIARALHDAGTYFGDVAATEASFEGAYTHDWQHDPFARGAYSYVLVGGERARAALAVPIDGVLWIAGEATADHGEGGTVAGALTSGRHAAREILAKHAT